MESAIPEHLRVSRTCPAGQPEGYQPPFPAWTARFPSVVGQVVMAYFGVQAADPPPASLLKEITAFFNVADGPGHWEQASCIDSAGYHNLIAVAYWPAAAQFDSWQQHSHFRRWWNDAGRGNHTHGYFLEVVSPQAGSFETLFSDRASPEGVARLASGMSDEIYEHGYWGSARDRLPLAQTHSLSGSSETPYHIRSGQRVVVSGRKNLCLIRSGQDWSATRQQEREKYLAEVEPVLREGMHFLRDSGQHIGCLSCRYMQVIDPKSSVPSEKTFGLAHFADMAALELWAKSHPTHVAIFGSFMRYVQELNFNIALRLWHEIVVVPPDAQYFEYINCHPATGLLAQTPGERQ